MDRMFYRAGIAVIVSLHFLLLFSQGRNDSLRARRLYERGVRTQEEIRDYPAALADYRQALALDAGAHLYRETLRDYATILNLYFYAGDYPDAMEAATEELALVEEHRDTVQLARCYCTIGSIYSRQGNLREAGSYFGLYADLANKVKDSLMIADAYSNIGEVGAGGKRFDVALGSLFSAYDLYDHLKDSERIVYTSYQLSRVYQAMGKFNDAIVYAGKTLKKIDRVWCNEYDRALYYINAGDIYKDLGDLRSAVDMTRRGLDLATYIRHREYTLDARRTLAGIYALQHRFDSAYFYYTLYAALKDSINNERSQLAVEEIREHYAVDKKDREIALQKELLARQRLVRNILLFSSLFVVATILLLYNRRRLKQRAEYEIKLNRQRSDLFGAVIMAQENERKRIAQDIHDTLGSLLSAAKLNLSALDEDKLSADTEQARRYRTSLKLLDEVSVELRNIAHNIMPAGLSKIGLPAAVKGLLDTLSAPAGLRTNYNVYGFDERLTEEVEISIYRILLELINNVIKHSRATLLTVQMIRYPRYVNIVVEDDGIGFDGGPRSRKGMGLGNIRSRVSYLKGTMEFDSKEGAGTTVLIEIPC